METKIFKNDAKTLVDLMFETKILKEDVTRDEMNSFEEFIQFCLESRFDSYKLIDSLTKRAKEFKPSQDAK